MKENKLKSLSPEELQKKYKSLGIAMIGVFVIMIITAIGIYFLTEEDSSNKIMTVIPAAFIPYLVTNLIFRIKVKKEIESRKEGAK